MRSIVRALSLLACLAGCAPTVTVVPGARVDETFTHPSADPLGAFDECTVYTAREPATSAAHREPCSELVYDPSPPAGGPHYSVWANFVFYDAPVPWGFLVHSLEHGAVILAYDSDLASAAEVRTTFEAIADAHGIDERCRDEEWPNRIIVVPDPSLAWPIAVRAWEHVYDATCLDRASIEAFVAAHYAHGPEDFCFAGQDRSGTGWCP